MFKDVLLRYLRDPLIKKIFLFAGGGYLILVLAVTLSPLRNPSPEGGQGGSASGKEASDKKASARGRIAKKKPVEAGAPLTALEQTGLQRVRYAKGTISAEWFGSPRAPRTGVLRAYYPDGTLWLEAMFQSGQMNGRIKTFYPGGILWGELSLAQGILSGESRWNYGNGKVWIKMTASNGACEQIPEAYSESGEPARTSKQSDSQGSGYFKVLDASGKPIAQWGSSGEDTTAEGIRVFYAGGDPSLVLGASAGSLEGTSTLYYPGKFVFQEMGFQSGRLTEGIKTYYPGGALWTELVPDAQTREVTLRAFYEDGSLWLSGEDKDLQQPCPLRMYSEGESRKAGGK